MKKILFSLFLFFIAAGLSGQPTDPLVSSCLKTSGPNARYLKDFRIQLGKAASGADMRFKANISLWRNTKYRFTLCNTEDSKGKLILTIKDEADNVVLTSYDQKTGKIYPYVDFICNKSGIYQLNFDFENGQKGSGVGVVSMIR
ncbi:MAG: hypothetical protein IQL11_02620 [Bacteroidales bacterium]|nr:hypothetical protein [Bacteroidales bacterium]